MKLPTPLTASSPKPPVPPLPPLLLIFLLGIASAQTANLKGRVLERIGMQPVPGAAVKLSGSSLSAVTGADGRFVLSGSTAGIAPMGAERIEFDIRGGQLHVKNRSSGRSVRVEVLDLSGRLLSEAAHVLDGSGWNRLNAPPMPSDFVGFLRIVTEGGTMLTRVLSLGGALHSGIPLRQAGSIVSVSASAQALAKSVVPAAAAVEVSVSKERLVPKSLGFPGIDGDMGDIILDYPPRVLGLGAPPLYGADVLFPAEGDSAAVRAAFEAVWIHKMNGWRQGQGLGTTPVLWKVISDPDGPAGSFRPSLSPCCAVRNGSPGWGYDDIITKKTYLDFQLHLEFNMMGLSDGNASSAGYCNSGVYLRNNLELQIETPKANPSNYEKLHAICTLIDIRLPDKDMYLGAGKWQSYDITFRAPRADSPAKVSVWWNKELVHNNQSWQGAGAAAKVGFALQNELGSDVRYRNVWLKELDIKEAQTNFGH